MTMTILVLLGDVACFAAGFASCWFGRDMIEKLVIGANALSKKLHAKADALMGKK
jgi:hypothetical protein